MVTEMTVLPPPPGINELRQFFVIGVLSGLLAGCTATGPDPAAAPRSGSPTAVGRGAVESPPVDPGGVQSPPVAREAFVATVVRVVDGDTLIAMPSGTSRPLRVRLIGIDTPETVRPDAPVACYGERASALTSRLLTGARVRASYEPGGRADRFGRELWDVWLPDGRFLQAVLVTAGAARAYPYRPQVRYAGLLGRLADAARAAHRGLWGPPCNGRSFP